MYFHKLFFFIQLFKCGHFEMVSLNKKLLQLSINEIDLIKCVMIRKCFLKVKRETKTTERNLINFMSIQFSKNLKVVRFV